MKSLVYHLKDNLIENIEYLEKNGRYHKDIFHRLKKRLKNNLATPLEIVEEAKIIVRKQLEDNQDLSPKEKKIHEFQLNVFYGMLCLSYSDNDGEDYQLGRPWHGYESSGYLRKYYAFVPDFADNLKKVTIPKINKITMEEVFHDKQDYIELIFKETIISIMVFRNKKNEISNMVCTEFRLFEQTICPTHSNLAYTGGEKPLDDSIGDRPFKEIWERCKKVNDTNFIASCLLYINSGDPDIRHMKGENPQKYKINSKDSFFEKRKKQEGVKDAIFNDYEIVGWNYKKKYNVAGHWRYQACGPKWSQHKLIFIESFEKGTKKEQRND